MTFWDGLIVTLLMDAFVVIVGYYSYRKYRENNE